MLINITKLVNGDSKKINFSKDVILPKGYANDDIANITFDGVLTLNDGLYIVVGKLNIVLNLNCNLCLQSFDYSLSIDFNETFSKEQLKEFENEKDFWIIQNNQQIDLEPAIISNILTNIPMKTVCSDDCKGLCNICGHNLNISECGCDRFNYDPRMQIFKNLLNDKEVQ